MAEVYEAQVGDAIEEQGFVSIKYAERIENGTVRESVLVLRPDEYTGTFPRISFETKTVEVRGTTRTDRIAVTDGDLNATLDVARVR